MCVLMSTHTLAAAEEIAQRVGIMNHGRLIYDGTIAQLRQQFRGPNEIRWKRCTWRSPKMTRPIDALSDEVIALSTAEPAFTGMPRSATHSDRFPGACRTVGACRPKTAKRNSCGGCGFSLARPHLRQLLRYCAAANGAGRGAELVLLGRAVRAVLRGLYRSSSSTSARPGRRITRRPFASCFTCSLLSLNVMLVFSSRHHSVHGAVSLARDAVTCSRCRCGRSGSCSTSFKKRVFFSSWGFFLLASPIMIAYGIVVATPLVLLRAACCR